MAASTGLLVPFVSILVWKQLHLLIRDVVMRPEMMQTETWGEIITSNGDGVGLSTGKGDDRLEVGVKQQLMAKVNMGCTQSPEW